MQPVIAAALVGFVFLVGSVSSTRPAQAAEPTVLTVTRTCGESGKLCIRLSGTVAPGSPRLILHLEVDAMGALGLDGRVLGLVALPRIEVPANASDRAVPFDSGPVCFLPPDTLFLEEALVWSAVTDVDGHDIAASVSIVSPDGATVTSGHLPDILLREVRRVCPSPVPSGPASTPASGARTAPSLAATGGLDLRYPAVGAGLLLLGFLLLLVRGRRFGRE